MPAGPSKEKVCSDFCSHITELRQYLETKEMALQEDCGQLNEAVAKYIHLSDTIRLLRDIEPNMSAETLLAVLVQVHI